MSDRHENEMTPLERSLLQLSPAAARVDRDALFFAAGQAAAQSLAPPRVLAWRNRVGHWAALVCVGCVGMWLGHVTWPKGAATDHVSKVVTTIPIAHSAEPNSVASVEKLDLVALLGGRRELPAATATDLHGPRKLLQLRQDVAAGKSSEFARRISADEALPAAVPKTYLDILREETL